jgi:hypothetical protein
MTWEYRWENTPYDTQSWEYRRFRGAHSQVLGEVKRVIRARQSYDEPVHEYQARAFSIPENKTFNTRIEAEAWVTACERM